MLETLAAAPATFARALPGRRTSRHARARRRRGRLHRRLLAYREVQIVHAPAPLAGADSLLLVHTRRIVGQLTYELCEQCASGVITELQVTSPLQDSGLGTRAVAHLRACYPDIAWRSGLTQRMTRDLSRRMGLRRTGAGRTCVHSSSRQEPETRPVPSHRAV
ncbi:hypothetical protein [Streptomyces sp. NPDC049813]|uniref:hypothetical protein n=1 Tax=Streptomyces sp. NPDC049813 TaxID=3365597 RepID=UPI0037A48C81